jgi:ribosomal protein L12E/L44/L45/RPP1/RPP2
MYVLRACGTVAREVGEKAAGKRVKRQTDEEKKEEKEEEKQEKEMGAGLVSIINVTRKSTG